jgi:lycopene cyclase domain-containing protein
MVGTRFDYLLILAVLLLFVGAAHGEDIRAAARKTEFWTAGVVYLFCCGVLDSIAIRLRWWTFNESKISGVAFADIPVEEFVLFGAIYGLTIGTWTRPS